MLLQKSQKIFNADYDFTSKQNEKWCMFFFHFMSYRAADGHFLKIIKHHRASRVTFTFLLPK